MRTGMRSIYVRPRWAELLDRAVEFESEESGEAPSISRTVEAAVRLYVAKREAAAAAKAEREAYARDYEVAYQAAYARGRGSWAGVYRYVHEQTGRATVEAPPEGEEGWRECTHEEMDDQDESVTEWTCREAAEYAAKRLRALRSADNVTDDELAEAGWKRVDGEYEFTGLYTAEAIEARRRLEAQRSTSPIADW